MPARTTTLHNPALLFLHTHPKVTYVYYGTVDNSLGVDPAEVPIKAWTGKDDVVEIHTEL